MRRPPLNELQDSLDFVYGSLEEAGDIAFEDNNESFIAEIDDQLERLGGLQIPQIPEAVSEDFRELNALTSRFFVGNRSEFVTPTSVSDAPLFLNSYWQHQNANDGDKARERVSDSLKLARNLMHQELELAALNFFLVSDILPEEIADKLSATGNFEFEILLNFREDQWAKYWDGLELKQLVRLRERLNQELTERNDYISPITVWRNSWDLIKSERYCLRRGNTVRGSFNIRRVAFNLEIGRLKPSDKLCSLSDGRWYSFAGLFKDVHGGENVEQRIDSRSKSPVKVSNTTIGDHSSEETVDEKFYLAFRAGTGRVQIQHSNKMLITYSHTGWFSGASAGVNFENLVETENSGIAETDNEIPRSLFNGTLEFINKNLIAVFSGLCEGVVASCDEFALEQILNGESHGWKETIAELGQPRDASYATEYEWELAKGENRAVTVVWVGGDAEYLAILGQFPDAYSRLIFDAPLPFTEGWLTGYDYEDVLAEYSEQKQLQGNITQQLFAAIEAGDNASVQSCIKQGADLDEQSQEHDGRTPLLFSVEIGNAEVVQSIATAVEDLELAHYSDYLSPWLKSKVSGKTDIADILADCGAEVKLKEALSYAINHGDLDLAKTLLAEGAPVDGKQDGYCWGDPPIIEAAKSGQLEITQLLIEFGADLHTSDNGATTYVQAFSNGHFELANFFKDAGCVVDVQYCLIYSARTGNLAAIEKALNEGAEINTRRALSYSTCNAIEAAVASNDFPTDENGDSLILRKQILRYLVEKGADPNCVNDGKPLLHLAIENCYQWDIPGLLLELGSTLEAVNTENGQSTLFCVADKSNASMLYEYSAAGGDVSGVDDDGRNALHLYLSEASYFDIAYIKTLVGVGVDLSLTDNAGKSVTDILSDKRNELEEDELERLDEVQEALDQPGLGGILRTQPETGEQYVAKAKLTLEILNEEDISLAILKEGASKGFELSIPLSEHLETDEWMWEQVVVRTLGSIELAPSTLDAVLAKYNQIYDLEIKAGIRNQLELAGAELPLIPSELTSLSESNARKLVESLEEHGHLDLSGLTQIEADAVQHLCKTEASLGLDGLRSISTDVAKSLGARDQAVWLDGISELDEETASALAGSQSLLTLNGIEAISPSVAAALAKHCGELQLNQIVTLDDQSAASLATHNGGLQLNNLENISNAGASSLATIKGTLGLDGLRNISTEVAKSLGARDQAVWLDAISELDEETASALAGSQSQLTLNGIEAISPSVAAALAKHCGELQLNQIVTLDDQSAASLATHNGGLQLNNLENISNAGASSLATIKGALSITLDNITPESSANILRSKCEEE